MSARRMIVVLLMFLCAVAQAQNYPTRPVRFVNGSVGAGGDIASRLLAPVMSPAFGQQILIENRASGVILGDTVANAAPDGHTLLISGASFWLTPLLQPGVSWDPLRDFVPIALLFTSPNLVVVHPSLPARSVKELIALAKARPGQLNYGSGAPGSTPHLAGELFKDMAKVDIVRINYKGIGPAVTDLVGGQVHMVFANGSAAVAQLKAGRLRALAVAALKPSALFPELPTVDSSGLPGYEAEVLSGMFAPAKTPPAIVSRINQETLRALNRPDIKERLFNAGLEVIAGSADQLLAAVKRETTVWGKLIREQSIRAE